MKTETSAGGVILCSVDHEWYVLMLKDMNDTWTFPKGMIEKGETSTAAAAREIQEEVGISGLTYLHSLPTIQYVYKRNGLVKKVVHYFVYQSKILVEPKVQKEEGIHEAKWVRIDEAMNIIGYRETNVKLLDVVRTYLLSSPT